MTVVQRTANMFSHWIATHDNARDPVLREGVYNRADMRSCWDAANARIRTELQRRMTEELMGGDNKLQQELTLMAQVMLQWKPTMTHAERFEWQLLRGKAISALRHRGFIGEDDDGDS